MGSVEWLTEQIKWQEIELATLNADFEGDKDLNPVLQKFELIWGVKEHLLHLNVHKIVAEAVDKFCSTAHTMQENVRTDLRRLESRVNELHEFAHKSEENIEKQIAKLTKQQFADDRQPQFAAKERHSTLEKSISELFQRVGEVQKYIDAVDNKLRMQNVVVHGLNSSDPEKAIESLLKNQPKLCSSNDTVHAIGQGSTSSRPTLVRFQSLKEKNNFYKLSRTTVFKQQNPTVSVVDDETVLRHVGASRLAAAASELKRQFSAAQIRPRSAVIGNKKFDAASFVTDLLNVGSVPFNVKRAIENNKA